MDKKTSAENNSLEIVSWGKKYDVGIESINLQHKKIIDITNQLYQACYAENKVTETVFKESMSRMVEYVRYHFATEQELLKRINYPGYLDHKKEHERLITQILAAVKDFNNGKKFIPNQFVRTLRDWIFNHIAITDKNYALFVTKQKREGLLGKEQLQ